MNEHSNPSKEDLASFQRFVDAFEAEGFVAGEWAKMREIEPGVFQLGYWVDSPIVNEWVQAIYDRHVLDGRGRHMSYSTFEMARAFSRDPVLLETADLDSIRLVLTRTVRGERFCEGIIEGTFLDGMAQAATRRLVALGKAME